MKKKSLFCGVSAKLALAVVALAGTMFASCEKEELTVQQPDPTDPIVVPTPAEPEDASATIAITVYDAETSVVITDAKIVDADGNEVKNNRVEVPAGADGKISAKTIIYTATRDEYISAQGIAIVPALAKGQYQYIPVSIFMQKIETAGTNVKVTEDSQSTQTSTEEEKTEPKQNTSDSPTTEVLKYNARVGQEVTNLQEVYDYIDALVPVTRMTNSEIRAILKSRVKSLHIGFSDVEQTKSVTIDPYYSATLTNTVEYKETTRTLTMTIETVEYIIPNIKVKEVVGNTVKVELVYIGHGHGHGDTPNEGGGSGDAE